MRRRVPALSRAITVRIQRDVQAYAGAPDGRRRRLIELAVTSAVHHFVLAAEGTAGSGAAVDDLFRRMGRGEAVAGHPLDAMRTALGLATRDAWTVLHGAAVETGLPATVLGPLGDDMLAWVDHLLDQVALGHAAGLASLGDELPRHRLALLLALLDVRGVDPAGLRRRARRARWTPPEAVVVAAVATHLPACLPNPAAFETDVLADVRRPVAALVWDAARAEEALVEVGQTFAPTRLAVTGPVPVADVARAYDRAATALDLVLTGALPDRAVTRVADHPGAVLAARDGDLAAAVRSALLAPLDPVPPAHRRALVTTLAAWLPTRPPAAALAVELGVHPQTVRHRMRRLRALLGPRLDDPGWVRALLPVLPAATDPLGPSGRVGP